RDAVDRAGAEAQEGRGIHFAGIAPQVRGLVAEVAYRGHPIARQLALISDVPVRHISWLRINRHVDVYAGGREKRLPILRKWISSGLTLPRIRKSANRVRRIESSAYWSISRLALIEPGLGNIVEERSADTKRVASVAVRIEYQSHARREIGQVPVPHRI